MQNDPTQVFVEAVIIDPTPPNAAPGAAPKLWVYHPLVVNEAVPLSFTGIGAQPLVQPKQIPAGLISGNAKIGIWFGMSFKKKE